MSKEQVLDIGHINCLVYLHTTERIVIVHRDSIGMLDRRVTRREGERARKMRINRANKRKKRGL